MFYNSNMEKMPKGGDGEQLKINFENVEVEQQRKEIIDMLSGLYPDYFKENNLRKENDEWCIVRLGKCLPIPEWIKETEDDVGYHSKDTEKERKDLR